MLFFRLMCVFSAGRMEQNLDRILGGASDNNSLKWEGSHDCGVTTFKIICMSYFTVDYLI